MKTFVFFFAIFVFSVASYAQDFEASEKLFSHKHEFGTHIGAVTGIGISYRYWHSDAGLQLTLLPIKTQYSSIYSIGLSGLYSFNKTPYVQFFGYAGTHLLAVNTKENYSAGIGTGFAFGKTVTFNLQIGYAAYYGSHTVLRLLPTGEMGLYYRF